VCAAAEEKEEEEEERAARKHQFPFQTINQKAKKSLCAFDSLSLLSPQPKSGGLAFCEATTNQVKLFRNSLSVALYSLSLSPRQS
jgi:hypothetical protein